MDDDYKYEIFITIWQGELGFLLESETYDLLRIPQYIKGEDDFSEFNPIPLKKLIRQSKRIIRHLEKRFELYPADNDYKTHLYYIFLASKILGDDGNVPLWMLPYIEAFPKYDIEPQTDDSKKEVEEFIYYCKVSARKEKIAKFLKNKKAYSM